MARITVEDCLENVPNRFALVMLVAKRAKQLIKGGEATLASRNNKKIVLSLREVAHGTVAFDGVDDARALMEITRDLTK